MAPHCVPRPTPRERQRHIFYKLRGPTNPKENLWFVMSDNDVEVEETYTECDPKTGKEKKCIRWRKPIQRLLDTYYDLDLLNQDYFIVFGDRDFTSSRLISREELQQTFIF